MNKRLKYTPKMLAWLRDNVAGVPFAEITKKFNRCFGCNVTTAALEQKARKIGLCNGLIGGRFKKGDAPWNKGQKMRPETLEKIRPTLFKAGARTANQRNVGDERMDKDGYVIVKVAEPRTWRRKHFIEWEKYHEPIDPNKECLIFLDGDRKNCDISNLRKITRAQNATLSIKKLWQDTPQTFESALLLVDLIHTAAKKKKKQ